MNATISVTIKLKPGVASVWAGKMHLFSITKTADGFYLTDAADINHFSQITNADDFIALVADWLKIDAGFVAGIVKSISQPA